MFYSITGIYLRTPDITTMVSLLDEMIVEFKADCDKRSADKLFRIHWDGDFFSETYAYAWKTVIEKHSLTIIYVHENTSSRVL